jgi:hypothetical protein
MFGHNSVSPWRRRPPGGEPREPVPQKFRAQLQDLPSRGRRPLVGIGRGDRPRARSLDRGGPRDPPDVGTIPGPAAPRARCSSRSLSSPSRSSGPRRASPFWQAAAGQAAATTRSGPGWELGAGWARPRTLAAALFSGACPIAGSFPPAGGGRPKRGRAGRGAGQSRGPSRRRSARQKALATRSGSAETRRLSCPSTFSLSVVSRIGPPSLDQRLRAAPYLLCVVGSTILAEAFRL